MLATSAALALNSVPVAFTFGNCSFKISFPGNFHKGSQPLSTVQSSRRSDKIWPLTILLSQGLEIKVSKPGGYDTYNPHAAKCIYITLSPASLAIRT
ncbi:hypothetical protein F4782DRAFT_479136 [Xylaria castorea]|nr:hypothetical protein F4782DRAFT_479136 [Xylaria castorea]